MTHVRQQIREACAALVTGLATTGSRVFQSRMRPQKESHLPCLLVTTNDEQIDGSATGIQERRLTLEIRGLAMATANLDDTLDTMALEIETAMSATGYALEKIEVDFDDELEKPVGSVALTYQVLYFTNAGTPGTPA